MSNLRRTPTTARATAADTNLLPASYTHRPPRESQPGHAETPACSKQHVQPPITPTDFTTVVELEVGGGFSTSGTARARLLKIGSPGTAHPISGDYLIEYLKATTYSLRTYTAGGSVGPAAPEEG